MRSIVTLALLLASTQALAVPLTLSHQGRVFDDSGLPLDAATDVSVALFDTDTAGTALWSDAFTGVPFDAGYFSLVIGSGAALDSAAFDGDDVWLEMTVDGDVLPRTKLSSVPFAIRAGTADTAIDLSGGVVDASEIRVNGTTIIDSTGQISGASLPGGDGNLLLELGCVNAGEVAMFDGLDWQCAPVVSAHTHDASEIDTGTMDIARLPVGASATDVAPGDHLHAFADVTGQVGFGQLPVGAAADQVSAGNHSHAPGDADTLDGQDSGDFAANSHTHAFGDVTGTIDADSLQGSVATDFAASGHAHAAGDADTLDGQDSTDFATSGHAHSTAFSDLSGAAVIGQLPVGTSATTVAQGDHTHAASDLTGTIDADTLQGLAASGGTDSSADIVALIDRRVCEGRGGVWSDTSGCSEWMQRTTAAVDSSERWSQCSAEFGATYTPCSAFEALGNSMLYPVTRTTYYWLHAGGTETQATTNTLWRDCCGAAGISAQPRCPAGQTVSFFHAWNNAHVDSVGCRANTDALPVLCCRNTYY